MTSTTTKSAYWEGFRAGLPFVVMAVPFAMLFGVVGAEAGLSVAQVMGFSLVVTAGAAQFTAVQLMVDEAPTIIVLLAALAVNLRMAMYSASLQPYLGDAPLWHRAAAAYCNLDQSYAMGIQKFEATPDMTVSARYGYFFGVVTPLMPLWMAFTWVGAVLGAAIPEGVPLDYAMPILFLALTAPMVRTLAHLAAAVTAVVAVLILHVWLPTGVDVLVAGLIAMVVGAEVERRRGR